MENKIEENKINQTETGETVLKTESNETTQSNENTGSSELKESSASDVITRKTTIGDITQKYPFSAEILLSFGVHCVGCQASPFETLEEGLMSHGLDNDAVDDVVKKLNEAVREHESVSVSSEDVASANVSLTDNAVKKLKEFCEQNNKKALRITVLPGGCSGYKYVLDLVDEKRADEVSIDSNGVLVFIDVKSLEKLNGSTIDFEDSLQGGGFKINNPNAENKCGC